MQFSSLSITYYASANPIVLSSVTPITAVRNKLRILLSRCCPPLPVTALSYHDNFPIVKNVDTLIFFILSAITASSFRKYPSPTFCRLQVLLCCPFSNHSGVSALSDVQHSISCVTTNSTLGNTVTSPLAQLGTFLLMSVYCTQAVTGASSRKPRFTPLSGIYSG